MDDLRDWIGDAFTGSTKPNLFDYYGVTTITVNDKDIKCNINNSTSPIAVPVLIEVSSTTTVPGVTTPKYGLLSYKNNGTVVDDSYELYVPVTVTYLWGQVAATVTVPVEKTTVDPASVNKQ